VKKNLPMSSTGALLLEFSAGIGETLLQIQKTEEILKLLVTHFLRTKELPWEQILAQEEKERKKP